ncbi:Protease synthase and sporulation protein PAI 2 [Burkholderiaceae bacterium]|nr:Protease synthase and sporulation protein PAI 2 [Burkholderiaceae bacterium]
MYVPSHFEETRSEVLHGLIHTHPLATLVAPGGAELAVSHIPLLLDPAHGPHGTLRGHVARANPLWRSLGGPMACVAIFQGPQAYVTPSWYASKHEHGKVVPTWNYAVVHAHGPARAIEDPAWLIAHLSAMTDVQESRQAQPWKVADAPKEYIERLMQAIVGIEIGITSLRGSWKVSQNRSQADRLGVAAGLRSRDDEASREMASLVMQRAG